MPNKYEDFLSRSPDIKKAEPKARMPMIESKGEVVLQPEKKVYRFKSVEEAEAANLPSGTRIFVDGRPATVR
jgi:hypothetical protein